MLQRGGRQLKGPLIRHALRDTLERTGRKDTHDQHRRIILPSPFSGDSGVCGGKRRMRGAFGNEIPFFEIFLLNFSAIMVNEGFTAGALRSYRSAVMSMILPPAPGMSALSASPCARLLHLQAHFPPGGFFLSPSWSEVRLLLESQGAGVSFGIGRQIRIAWRGRRASLQIRADGRMAEAETNALLGLINGDSNVPARIGLRSAWPASVTFDPQLELFVARALGISDLVMAAGRNGTQVACAFEIAVMDYQSFCKARGEAPAQFASSPTIAPELDVSSSPVVLPLLTT